jgi:hypothetical protein
LIAFGWIVPTRSGERRKRILLGEDPDAVNHLNWYMATGFTRPYPGEKTIRPPSEFNNPAPAGDDDN